MTYLVLDSTFLIDHLRGDPEAIQRLARLFDDGDIPVVTDVVVCEVRTGLRDEDEHHLDALIEPMEFVQPGPEQAMTAGRWRAGLARIGRTLSLGDALIASSAESRSARVLTRNVRDFAMTPVGVETY